MTGLQYIDVGSNHLTGGFIRTAMQEFRPDLAVDQQQ